MKAKTSSKEVLRLILINIIPLLFLALLIPDLIEVVNSPGAYPFGNSINPQGSIYTSKEIYFGFGIVHLVALISLIVLSFLYKKKRTLYFVCLAINVMIFLYPIINSTD